MPLLSLFLFLSPKTSPVRWGKRIHFAETASLSLIGVCGESEDKADAAFIGKRTNEIPGNAGPSRPLLSHTTFGLMYCTCLAFPLAARSLRPLSFPRSFSSAAAVGVPGARSRRCLHRLWAGSKIPLPGDGLCTILRHHLLRHAHHLGASG